MAPRKSPAHAATVAPNGPSTLDAIQATPPFFNTTFSTHRVSPLFVGPQGLTTSRLELLARRLRDTLVGDVVRGIQIRRFQPQTILGETPSLDSEEVEAGLWVEICHENSAYAALLLPSLAESADGQRPSWATSLTNTMSKTQFDQKQFINLPLLLLRMPHGLKTVIGEWLSTMFDCRVSKLTLGTKTLINVWEGWISSAGIPSKGSDFVMTLAFNAPATEPGLRTLEIAISPSDLGRFLRAGQADGSRQVTVTAPWEHDPRERRRLAGGNADDGWAWRHGREQPKHPFTEALARYVDHHLAMNLFHPSVRVVQISCGAFVLAQSRLKVVKAGDITPDLTRAAWMFVTQLGARVCDSSSLI
ncbi:kinetochore complex sim4 subunit fta1 domain-containing protein [Hirsutella rhossiliensis]|uniref:Kinetochore complex sim4 subunit fta1 domain-containing protein n=1 Tax=Hirsutella rhossiliensis TaxID=111463 RepID=A0A9P8SHB2_9HYPO|nr:kinetochore complex sim4 subunit fta1 domain-containing protein [Hirsutella rhossiliensis]KAH0961984.1 kinetochore complex sim4 subunit fta1 domain-containing protein [Hirsutella rhossiliensis]